MMKEFIPFHLSKKNDYAFVTLKLSILVCKPLFCTFNECSKWTNGRSFQQTYMYTFGHFKLFPVKTSHFKCTCRSTSKL